MGSMKIIKMSSFFIMYDCLNLIIDFYFEVCFFVHYDAKIVLNLQSYMLF